jgi:hypothetical protein
MGVEVDVGVGVKLLWRFYPAHQWHSGSTRFADCALGSLQGILRELCCACEAFYDVRGGGKGGD